MKILIYSAAYPPAWDYGGPVKSVSLMAEGLKKIGHEVEVFTTDAYLPRKINCDSRYRQDGITVNVFRSRKLSYISCPPIVKAIKKRSGEFDLIYIVGCWQPINRSACQAALKSNVPYVIAAHGDLSSPAVRSKTIKKKLYLYLFLISYLKKASFIQFNSVKEKNESAWVKGIKSRVITNPFDIENWKPTASKVKKWRKKLHKNNDFAILYVGRLHPQKNLEFLVQSLCRVNSKNWKIFFIGNGDRTKTRLKKIFKKNNAENRAEFFTTLPSSELVNVYAAADLFVMPSFNESFSYATLEAIFSLCQVMVSDKIGVSEYLEAVKVGKILPIDSAIWTEELQKFLNQNRPSRFSIKNERFIQQFNPTKISLELIEAIDQT